MSYIVEQEIKGRIYLYKAESYWDKEKKQPRQKRTYIGPKETKNLPKINENNFKIISKNFGNVFLLKFLSDKLGLTEILKTIFPDEYQEILALAYYEIMEASPFYLFPYWHDEQYLPDVNKLHSGHISKLCEELGKSETQRFNFTQKWAEHLKSIKGIYYDITSISSYSSNIEFIEWGYNRDKEKLAQLNMGVTFCQNNSLPIFYNLYPGSIVDVTTLKNCVSYLKLFKLENILFILDRGFFSKANILEMSNSDNNISFIQPLPFSLKKVKDMIRTNRKHLSSYSNIFSYNNEILHHIVSPIDFDEKTFQAHIFLNEKAALEQKHKFLSELFGVKETFKDKLFENTKEYLVFKESNILEKYHDYFKWNKTTRKIEINNKNVDDYICLMGCFVLLTNQQEMDKIEILNYYRQRDSVEKVFDNVKNELNGDRLKVHSQCNTNGRLFIKFLALIIYSEISKTMKEHKLFEKYSLKELLLELKKLKITLINANTSILSEITKKQKIIFEAFGIKEVHSY